MYLVHMINVICKNFFFTIIIGMYLILFDCYFWYFCTRKNDADKNLVSEMQECGIWNDIIAL